MEGSLETYYWYSGATPAFFVQGTLMAVPGRPYLMSLIKLGFTCVQAFIIFLPVKTLRYHSVKDT